jgi:hypothetical protein
MGGNGFVGAVEHEPPRALRRLRAAHLSPHLLDRPGQSDPADLIIEDELDRLRHESVEPAELEAIVRDLVARAEWYGIELEVADLLDIAEEASGIGAAVS